MRKLTWFLFFALAVKVALAYSWIGDAGHFLKHTPPIHLLSPDANGFTVTVHRHVWAADWANNGDYAIRLEAPDCSIVAEASIPSGQAEAKIALEKSVPGVYRLLIDGAGYDLTWVESSLDRMVIERGDWEARDKEDAKSWPYRTFNLHAMVPRRWYFFVPEDLKRFEVKHTVFQFESHREDHGLFVASPRGQRMAALFGGKPLAMGNGEPEVEFAVSQTIEVDPGTANRFWSFWACGGDSHNYSDLQVMLSDPIPPYYAPSPEQWFDPRTGVAPDPIIYDASQIRALDRFCDQHAPDGHLLSRDHYLWTPATFLGDEDYNGMLGPATILLANPEGRPLEFGICSYILNGRKPVRFLWASPDGAAKLDESTTFAHRDSARVFIPAANGGISTMKVNAGNWFAWCEPMVPMALEGEQILGVNMAAGGSSASRFHLEVGVARNWFFKVPEGTRSFTVHAVTGGPDEVIQVDVNAPDRIVRSFQASGPGMEGFSQHIVVPKGLDGKIWSLNLGVGSATRFVSTDPENPVQPRINLDLDLIGVPGYLAPTWEQAFHAIPSAK